MCEVETPFFHSQYMNSPRILGCQKDIAIYSHYETSSLFSNSIFYPEQCNIFILTKKKPRERDREKYGRGRERKEMRNRSMAGNYSKRKKKELPDMIAKACQRNEFLSLSKDLLTQSR